jgi:hypothetical protein
MDDRGPASQATADRTGAGVDTDEAAADEAAASAARRRYRADGLVPLALPGPVAALLEPGEQVYAEHEAVSASYFSAPSDAVDPEPVSGSLYVTSRRILVTGSHVLAAPLAELEETILGPGRLLLVLRHGVGIAVDLERPHLLRVQVAAARAAARGPAGEAPGTELS